MNAAWRRTILAVAIDAAGVFVAAMQLRERFDAVLSATIAFVAVQLGAIALILALRGLRHQMRAFRAARSRRLAPQIRDALAAHATGFDQTSRLDQLRRLEPRDVREALFAMLQASHGERRDRLASLVPELGLLEWRSRQKPIERIRDLVRLGGVERFEQIVTEAAQQSRFVRVIAAEELRPYAADISQSQIRHALEASDANVKAAALEMLQAWQRALP